MRLISTALTCSMILCGCGQANAATVDPSDDVHCSILAFYFYDQARKRDAPAEQKRATTGMHEWYAAKLRAVAVGRWGDKAGFEKEAAPLLDAIKSDPSAMRDEMLTCTDRAATDPAFGKHARAYGFSR